jgi:hypothetical protein
MYVKNYYLLLAEMAQEVQCLPWQPWGPKFTPVPPNKITTKNKNNSKIITTS